jgi:hypothetical protein
MSSVVISGDTSGAITLSAPAVAGTTTLTLPATSGTVLQSGTTVTEAQGGTGTTTGYYGFKNRIINGAMTIAQYGTSTALAAGSSNGCAADRFRGFNIGDGACSIIQATNAPPSTNGFINSVQIDVTTADTSIAAGELYMVRQTIEGLNITDLAWGTANAKTITLSFWVSSPKTGTHFVAFKNQAQDRCYAASYTVSVADTWEQKTITVAGDTSGTWLTTNNSGIQVVWALAIGSTFQTATADVWAAGDGYATSAQVNVMDSTANNFYITGVQLEKGSTATSFDYRPYGTELALCQRYYYKIYPALANGNFFHTLSVSTTSCRGVVQFPETLRTPPAALEQSGAATDYSILRGGAATVTVCSSVPTFQSTTVDSATTIFTVASGFVSSSMGIAQTAAGTTAGYLAWSAEL